MRTNCVNCGAAIETDAVKCPFCGTSYFDLTAIDFTSSDPVALRLRLPGQGGTFLISMLATPHFETLEDQWDMVECYSSISKLMEIPRSRSVSANISFDAVTRGADLFNVKKEK